MDHSSSDKLRTSPDGLQSQLTSGGFANTFVQWKNSKYSTLWAKFCILASVIRHAKRMRHIVLLSVSTLALPYFPLYLINGMTKGKSYWTQNMYLIFPTTFVCKLSHSTKNLARYYKKKNWTDLYIKYPLFFYHILIKLETFSTYFRKILKY